MCPAMHGHAGDIPAAKFYLPLLGLIKSGEAIHQAGLAGTIWPDDRQDFVLIDMKGDIIQNLYSPEGQTDIVRRQSYCVICSYIVQKMFPFSF